MKAVVCICGAIGWGSNSAKVAYGVGEWDIRNRRRNCYSGKISVFERLAEIIQTGEEVLIVERCTVIEAWMGWWESCTQRQKSSINPGTRSVQLFVLQASGVGLVKDEWRNERAKEGIHTSLYAPSWSLIGDLDNRATVGDGGTCTSSVFAAFLGWTINWRAAALRARGLVLYARTVRA